MRPADTEEIPEMRDCKSVTYLGGNELKSEGNLEMEIKVEDFGGNSGSEDKVWKEIDDEAAEIGKIFKFQTKSLNTNQIYQLHIARNRSAEV